MYIVYILKSKKDSSKFYIGITNNLQRRLIEHNSSNAGYTLHYQPWEVEIYIVFKNKKLAENFEKYLKSGSGYAFLKKRFIS